jgi:hypothetical protein
VSFLVAEAGDWTVLESGITYQAGNIRTDGAWKRVNFESEMESPVVFSTISTDRHQRPMVTRQKSVNGQGFQVRL